jgi:hypothetical protein
MGAILPPRAASGLLWSFWRLPIDLLVKKAKAPCFLRRRVMQRWADFIDGKAETGKVVKIGGRKR